MEPNGELSKYNPENIKASEIISKWTFGIESQRPIAEQIYQVFEDDACDQLNNFFINRYKTASDEERNNIIVALGNLGARNLPVEIGNMDLLFDLAEDPDANNTLILREIRNKIMRLSLRLSEAEEDEKKQLIAPIEKAGKNLLSIIKTSTDENIKKEATIGIYQCALNQETRETMIQTLKGELTNASENYVDVITGELVSIMDPGSELIVQLFKNQVDKFDYENNDQNNRLIIMLGHGGNADFMPFLEEIRNHPKFSEYSTQKNINWAIEQLKSRKKDA